VRCTRCDGYGFINLEQIPESDMAWIEEHADFNDGVFKWMRDHEDHDVAVCDCCGDGEGWHDEPGVHNEAQYGKNGPYAYNGGLPECW